MKKLIIGLTFSGIFLLLSACCNDGCCGGDTCGYTAISTSGCCGDNSCWY